MNCSDRRCLSSHSRAAGVNAELGMEQLLRGEAAADMMKPAQAHEQAPAKQKFPAALRADLRPSIEEARYRSIVASMQV
jgi:hypothetical protein